VRVAGARREGAQHGAGARVERPRTSRARANHDRAVVRQRGRGGHQGARGDGQLGHAGRAARASLMTRRKRADTAADVRV
jgi:hypothetical protein